MKYPLFNLAPFFAAVAFCVVPTTDSFAAAVDSLTEEAADRIAAAAVEIDDLDMQTVATVVVSEPTEPPAWFPTLTGQDLAIDPSMGRVTDFAAPAPAEEGQIFYEHTAIPLPPAAWTGLVGLASLATVQGRKAIVRFFT